MKFITKDDDFGVISLLRELYPHKVKLWEDFDKGYEFRFRVWMNQFIPPVFIETKGTIQRHIKEIEAIQYDPKWVWIKRGNQYGCAILNHDIMNQIKNKQVELPTYQELEEEKQRWQNTPGYDEDEGFSQPIKEEMVQLVFRKGVK